MTDVESPESAFTKVLEEHRELRGLLAELLDFLEQPRPTLGSADADTWASSLTERLVTLHKKVNHHFREEEASGVLDDLQASFPRAARTIEALRTDHDRILADFRAAIHSAMCYTEGRPGETQNLRRWTRAIIEQIQAHEAEESELMQNLVNEDLGVGD